MNVKSIEYIADTEGFIKKKIKANFKALGSKLGPKMKAMSNAIANFGQQDISRIESKGQVAVTLDEEKYVLLLSEVEITAEDIPGWSVASKGSLTVALDITLPKNSGRKAMQES